MLITTTKNVPGGSIHKQPIEKHCKNLQLQRPDHKQSGFLLVLFSTAQRVYLQKANLETTLLLMHAGKNKIA